MSSISDIKDYRPNLMKIRWARIVSHLIILLLIFVAPELIFSLGKKMPINIYVGPIVYIATFYINYYVLVDKLLFKPKKRWQYFVVNLVIFIGVIMLLYWLHTISGPHFPKHFEQGRHMMPPPPPMDDDAMIRNHYLIGMMKMLPRAIPLLMAVVLSVVMKLGEKWQKWDRMEKQMKAELQETELKNLKNQLNPHFLFNTLNNIYALIPLSQQKAQLAVHDLSQLLRYILYDNDSREVSLEKELQFVKNYIALMRLRLNSQVTLTEDINVNDGMGQMIAPLMFISLVENAFKHGVSATAPSYINISIKVIEDKVKCHVENSYFPKKENDKSGSGIGISNLNRQLEILYSDRHKLQITTSDDKYIADLEIILTTNQ